MKTTATTTEPSGHRLVTATPCCNAAVKVGRAMRFTIKSCPECLVIYNVTLDETDETAEWEVRAIPVL